MKSYLKEGNDEYNFCQEPGGKVKEPATEPVNIMQEGGAKGAQGLERREKEKKKQDILIGYN